MPDYGNVPEDDVIAIQAAALMAERVAAQLPAGTPSSWNGVAYSSVLEGILKDWVANGTTDLDSDDEADLASLLKVAADTAMAQEASLRDTAFATLIKYCMQDWVDNWNAE